MEKRIVKIMVDPEFKSELEKALIDYKKTRKGKVSMAEFSSYLVTKKKEDKPQYDKKEIFGFRF